MNYNSYTKFLGHYSKSNILDELLFNLKECGEFFFSVSFIKETGFILLEEAIEEALKRGAKGTIVTSGYLNITQVESLRKLHKLSQEFSNFKAYFIKIDENSMYKSFHTKGYMFLKDNEATVIIGSSNMSETALTKNGGEWSLESKTEKSNELFVEAMNDFNNNISKSSNVLTDEVINEYDTSLIEFKYDNVAPNFMQEEALKALIQARKDGSDKALIVAAMGSGKTYLSAFDAKYEDAKRLLYICHNENILKKAKLEYESVFGNTRTYGFYVGAIKDKNADFLFSTNLSLSKIVDEFDKKAFDYIVIDEAHHTPAKTFLKIVNYFKPQFLLGMTGTPDRLDQQSVKKLFGNIIPYELSLRDAIKQKIIMPFKYYSISDDFVNYSTKADQTTLLKDMTSFDHGIFIKNEIDKHLSEINGKLKCIAFCVSVEHAKYLSQLMNRLGIESEYITGDVSISDRQALFNRLQDEKDSLKILFSINTMNEGVDLPLVNMALFLRPTESSTIFIQQLGRSLRKAENKNKPVIIDFIGKKYERSTYIAWALGSLTDAPVLTKPILKQILNGKTSIEAELGVEIRIDDKAKQEIEEYVDKYNFNKYEVLKKSYNEFKAFYNYQTFPKHVDFISSTSNFDLMRIINTHKSYYNFLIKADLNEHNVPKFTTSEREFIEYLSSMLPLSRAYEFKILGQLIDEGPKTYDELKSSCYQSIKVFDNKSFEHALRYLQRLCDSEDNQKKLYKYVVENDGVYSINYKLKDLEINKENDFIELDFNNSEFKKFVMDILEYGIMRFESEFDESGNGFELYKTYSRKEYTRVSNCKSVFTFQTGVIYPDEHNLAIFVDLIKKENVEEHLDYGDKFITNNKFEWESQTETIIGNNRYNRLTSFDKADVFVRKFQREDGVNLPYVYLGKGKLTEPRETKNKGKTVMFDVILDNKLPDNLFEQFNIENKA